MKPAGPVYAPAGTAKISETLGVTRTTITLTGMAPYAIYVAHYHKMGTAAPMGSAPATNTNMAMSSTDATATTTASTSTTSTDTTVAASTDMTTTVTMAPVTAAPNPCNSDGPAIMESRMIAQASADGKVTLTGIVPTALIRDAAYINVHHGRDFSGALADSGVICTPITMTMR
ncbi:hypothetical protein MSS93_10650 [Deinococcus radiodurans]|nr:hypothetical protein MSS93_10650 [Deinococcus radiodurans]